MSSDVGADGMLPLEIRGIPRAKEIVDMMKFFEFSFKPASSFEGTICFTFNVEHSDQKMRYLVECKRNQPVRAELVGVASTNLKYDCEVTSSIEDFLHVYSGKASAGEMAKMCYTGRVYISGLQFRLVTRFAQSFDFTSQKWNDFYTWEQQQQQRRGRQLGGDDTDDGIIEHVPRQIALYIRGGGVNMSMVQRGCFEASMGRIFGPRVLMTYTALVHQGRRLPHRPADLWSHFKNKKFSRAIRCALGHPSQSYTTHKHKAHLLPSKLRSDVLVLWESSYELISCPAIVPAPSTNTSLLLWSDSSLEADPVDALAPLDPPCRPANGSRFPAEAYTRRIDLRDAGMAQLSKIIDNVVGEAFQPAVKSNHVSAPARLMREVRKWILNSHEQTTAATDLHSVLRDIDGLICAQLGKPTRPAPCLQKEVPTADIIRYNTRRDLARIKQTMAGMKRTLLAHQISPKSLPDNMSLLTLDY
ncbi:hypothetical protein AaE_013918 [Aphanomyces astaci]|uniref:SCP2 domain-containing protein n=1 Tax=Aphanomyces astaci TaxID=112090 RepID=A0A6A4Z8U7_APHAT|nr:hypothetical protein AaE_013918 [Aphanomyces astaci]